MKMESKLVVLRFAVAVDGRERRGREGRREGGRGSLLLNRAIIL